MRKTICVLFLLVAACSGAPPNLEQQQVKGVVQAVEQGGKVLVISHEEVPGFMDAMTMSFHTERIKLAEGLKAGDAVVFTTTKKDGGWPITTLKKLK